MNKILNGQFLHCILFSMDSVFKGQCFKWKRSSVDNALNEQWHPGSMSLTGKDFNRDCLQLTMYLMGKVRNGQRLHWTMSLIDNEFNEQ